jgi:hypothetical protein
MPANARATASGTAQGAAVVRVPSPPSDVVVQSAKQVKVPSFVGMSMRLRHQLKEMSLQARAFAYNRQTALISR